MVHTSSGPASTHTVGQYSNWLSAVSSIQTQMLVEMQDLKETEHHNSFGKYTIIYSYKDGYRMPIILNLCRRGLYIIYYVTYTNICLQTHMHTCIHVHTHTHTHTRTPPPHTRIHIQYIVYILYVQYIHTYLLTKVI